MIKKPLSENFRHVCGEGRDAASYDANKLINHRTGQDVLSCPVIYELISIISDANKFINHRTGQDVRHLQGPAIMSLVESY